MVFEDFVVSDLLERKVVFWLLIIVWLSSIFDDVEIKFVGNDESMVLLGFVIEFWWLVICIMWFVGVMDVFIVDIDELLWIFVRSDFDCENGLVIDCVINIGVIESEVFCVVIYKVFDCVLFCVGLVNWLFEFVNVIFWLLSDWVVLD